VKTVLITGGTGFVGTHLTRLLLQEMEIELHATSFGNDGKDALLPAEQIHKLDLTDYEATKLLLEKVKPDQVYHLASIATVGNSFEQATKILLNNVRLQLNFLQALTELNSKARVVFVGSADEYGLSKEGELPISENHPLRPVNPYAVSKICQDMLAIAYTNAKGLEIVRARPFNHIGAGQTVGFAVSDFARQIALVEAGKQQQILVGNLTAKRDFSDVLDVVKAYKLLMDKGEIGEVYNIGSGQSVTMQAVLDELIGLSKVKVVVKEDPQRLRPSDIPEMRADISKIGKLGYKPQIALTDSLSQVLEYWRKKI
jgi:GDP-4-dehydro-6-deoxy-D-mannose reductase